MLDWRLPLNTKEPAIVQGQIECAWVSRAAMSTTVRLSTMTRASAHNRHDKMYASENDIDSVVVDDHNVGLAPFHRQLEDSYSITRMA
jgi:hypothetical protein